MFLEIFSNLNDTLSHSMIQQPTCMPPAGDFSQAEDFWQVMKRSWGEWEHWPTEAPSVGAVLFSGQMAISPCLSLCMGVVCSAACIRASFRSLATEGIPRASTLPAAVLQP